jgi:glycosyltransferase involved in cell wall biosynthesis
MHFTHFNAPLLYRRPLVVTIHDLTRFAFPPQRRRGKWQEWAHAAVWYSVVRRAVRVICVSETTRRQLLARCPWAKKKSVVIREGISEIFQAQTSGADKQILRRLRVSQPYLLNVGVWMQHKNHARLLSAFARLKARGWRGKLVITGAGRPSDVNVPQLVRKMGLEREVIFPGFVSDEELAVLYRHAEIFLFPSLAEGFGLPPLEAMASGTPVVASRAGSLPEILGRAAVWVNPWRVESIAEGIWGLLVSPPRCRKYTVEGLRHVQQYRWEKAARATWEVYREAWAIACQQRKIQVH